MSLRNVIAFLFAAALVACRAKEAPAPAAPIDIKPQLAAELKRLEAELTRLEAASASLPEDVRDLPKANRESLARAQAATTPELRLYRLREPFVGVETLAFLLEKKAALENVDSLAALWNEKRPSYQKKSITPEGSLLHRALVQSADNRARVLFQASLSYARISSPFGGLYYIAEAEGNLRYRDFVASLPSANETTKTPSAARLATELQSVQNETLKVFEGDPTSPLMIPVSARLKEAEELLNARRMEGATLALLESRLGLSRRKAELDPTTAPPPTAPPALTNESLRALFASVAREDNGKASGLVQRDVFPLYTTLLQAPGKMARSAASVTITLVRWPYT